MEPTPLLQLLKNASAIAGAFNEEVLQELRSVSSSHAEVVASLAASLESTEQQFLENAVVLTEDEATSIMILNEYHDSRLLKDPVRGGVLCKTMDEVKQVYACLERITRSGHANITGVVNRFRGAPHSGGNRDLVVFMTYHEVPCKLQVL